MEVRARYRSTERNLVAMPRFPDVQEIAPVLPSASRHVATPRPKKPVGGRHREYSSGSDTTRESTFLGAISITWTS